MGSNVIELRTLVFSSVFSVVQRNKRTSETGEPIFPTNIVCNRLGHCFTVLLLFLLKYLEKVIGKTTIRLIVLIVLSAAPGWRDV